ncbi:MAG: histidine phosphatase family protein [Candidatus Pacebacteria bacterium]|nr:histidine phosphatase family protein [Candidatus Paceibacterota bacterium]MDD5357003.1 histidine phosphatase family protein [Candidatus Paceibacterota bacterium]
MKIYFVRHGEDVADKARLCQGPNDPLTETGKKQAQSVGKRLKKIPIDRIFSSTYVRTKETAEIIAKVIGKEIEYSDLITEWKVPSELIGKSLEDESYQKIWSQVKGNLNEDWHYSDEESFSDLKSRARKAIDLFKNTKAEHLLVVTHARLLRMCVALALLDEELTLPTFSKFGAFFATKNTGITVVEYDPGKKDLKTKGWKLLVWNDHAHLDV